MSQNPTHTAKALIAALRGFINERPNLDGANYGDARGYWCDAKRITRAKEKAAAALWELDRQIYGGEQTAQRIRSAILYANCTGNGRLQVVDNGAGGFRVDYCTGQYWPVEYRPAAEQWLKAAAAALRFNS